MEKAQFLCIFSDRNIIRNVLLFCVVRVIYVLPKKERQVHIMKNGIRFTLEPKQRPKLAKEIGKILGTAPHYERVPSCAYDIAGYRLDKEGVLHIPEGVAVEMVEHLIRQLWEHGFQDDMEITEEVPVPPEASTVLAAEAEMARDASIQIARTRKIIFLVFFIVKISLFLIISF